MIPTDIEHLMLESWETVLPRLRNDPAEVARRIARRRLDLLARPWRPFCLAVKANDARIHPYRAILTPEHAIELDDPRHPYEYIDHDVRLTSELLRFLCRPFRIGWIGEPASDVAVKLGCSYSQLSALMKRGLFHVIPKKGLRGRHGPPVPVLQVDRWFDPMSDCNFEFPDPVWGTTPEQGPLWKRIPDGIEQNVRRHRLRMPQLSPHASDWRWICPGCGHLSHVIVRPLPPPMLDLQSDLPPEIRRTIYDCDERERGLQCFACLNCHRVRSCSRISKDLWNVLISLFSGGLLFGREVDRPPSFAARARRKRFQRRGPLPARSPNRAEVIRLLTETDWPQRRIAAELDITQPAVSGHAKRAFRDHSVTTRDELRAALSKRDAVPKVA